MKLASKLLSNSNEPCFQWLRRHYIQNDIPTQPHQRERAIWRTLSSIFEATIQMTKVIIGNGMNTTFMTDHWTLMRRFHLRLPTLFTFATHPNCMVLLLCIQWWSQNFDDRGAKFFFRLQGRHTCTHTTIHVRECASLAHV